MYSQVEEVGHVCVPVFYILHNHKWGDRFLVEMCMIYLCHFWQIILIFLRVLCFTHVSPMFHPCSYLILWKQCTAKQLVCESIQTIIINVWWKNRDVQVDFRGFGWVWYGLASSKVETVRLQCQIKIFTYEYKRSNNIKHWLKRLLQYGSPYLHSPDRALCGRYE